MGWWKADPVPEQQSKSESSSKPTSTSLSSSTATSAPSSTPVAPHPIAPGTTASECPVSPEARSVWLQAAKAKQQQQQQKSTSSSEPTSALHKVVTTRPTLPTTIASSQECSSDRIDQSLPPPPASLSPQQQSQTDCKPGSLRPLSNDREISTIPRGYPLPQAQQPRSSQPPTPSSPLPLPPSSIPSNSESETGHDTPTGNWIYPSELQFFNAVMRKQTNTTSSPREVASSVSSIIPIHNAVNERAWHMIRSWEGDSSKSCGGPKLLRFEGKGAGAKSPRAKMKSWSGYTEPFDRHDWTVQRCDGTEVEYVIDFYQGKSGMGGADSVGGGGLGGAGGAGATGLNFFLDVRPKLNSFEGWKMRFERVIGWR